MVPHTLTNPKEVEVRNPMAFAHSIRCPLYVFIEPRHPDATDSQNFVEMAKRAGKDCQFYLIPGDHFTMVRPSIAKSIEHFRKLMEL